MSGQKNNNAPALLMVLTVVFTILLAVIPGGLKIGPFETKQVDFFIDVKPDSLISMLHTPVNYAGFSVASTIGNEAPALENLPPGALQQLNAVGLEGNTAMLKAFFDALKQASSRKVRIAHYGDSALEGDLVSADLRRFMQKQFGGNGTGYISITGLDNSFRTTVKHSFSDNWKSGAIFSSNPSRMPVGINGAAYQGVEGSWVRYEANSLLGGFKSFSQVRLFYSADKPGQVKYSFNDGAEQAGSLKASKNLVEEFVVSAPKSKSIKFTLGSNTANYFFGASLEDGNGVYVDNLPLRGNSGASLRDIDDKMLKEFARLQDYKLIILNFGLNMVEATKDFRQYESEMAQVINKFKTAFPSAGIIVMSVQDKSKKEGTRFVTHPNVLKLVESQKKIAQAANVVFWNLFEAMGGKDAMNQWVASGKAQKDYTHVTLDGAKKIAEMLSQAVIDAYNKSK